MVLFLRGDQMPDCMLIVPDKPKKQGLHIFPDLFLILNII